MARKDRPGGDDERWAARVAALGGAVAEAPTGRGPLSVDLIVRTALVIVEREGFDALTMRRVATVLQTGPASLYAHVQNKADLDDLLIGHLCAGIAVPTPDAARWREQAAQVCRDLRDRYLRYPGISRAALSAAPHNPDTLRISEGLLAILLAGGVSPRDAAWAIDAVLLYVAAYCFESSVRENGSGATDPAVDRRRQAMDRLAMLPPRLFPNTVAHARELTSGEGHERFDFTLDLMLGS
ncbi:TetR family transcriptional regulator [Nakamurella sp. YIM 132087]|uniref:TetR family transcriptional regulator n=1 Tax=Nakamurella alba TaxID=2665158 RepID=A0A7K1FSU6_9ACTN|nr:TetR/AcrR family transcriptional regulator C-terminal domain-containing protein [Nakamurella alba]MTD17150.1 TetR family transcriptional regulator [Nakamurella alba]